MQVLKDEIVFPYHLFDRNEKVMMYGAGRIGKALYRASKEDGILSVERIFDKRGILASDEDLLVSDPKLIPNIRDAAWLISIENEKIALEARQSLMNYGIPEDKIRWDGRRYRKCYGEKLDKESKKILKRILTDGFKRRMYVFDLPEHGNLGDYAIALGEKRFFEDYFQEYEIIWVMPAEWFELKDIFLESINEKDIIFLTGGGNLGDLWSSWEADKDLLNCFPNNIRILFPNTLSYLKPLSDKNKSLRIDINWLESQKNLYLFVRDINSFNYLSASSVKCYFAPDMALYLAGQYDYDYMPENKSALLCLRSDKEGIIEDGERIGNVLSENGYYVEERDIHLGRYTSLEEGYHCIEDYIKNLNRMEITITDRLHVMIFSALAGTPCIAFDNLTHKLSGVYPWLSDLSNHIITEPKNLDIHGVDQLKKIGKVKYQRPEAAFKKMSEEIKKIIESG